MVRIKCEHALKRVLRVKAATSECQKTGNIDLLGILTGCENCFQCVQRLIAVERDHIRIVNLIFLVFFNQFLSFLFTVRVGSNSWRLYCSTTSLS